MFAVLEAGRFLYGDVLVDLIASVVYPEADLRLKLAASWANRTAAEPGIERVIIKGGLLRVDSMGSWIGTAGSLSVATFLLIFAVLLVIISTLHIPLPYEICDRNKVQFFEFLLRVSNEYVGNLVEILFGPVWRNKFTRFVAGIPYYMPKFSTPKWCTVTNERIGDVPCRVYRPQGVHRRSDSLLVFIHGGGWCIMRPRYYDGPLMSLIRRTGSQIVSIDYDLSPEKRFPTAIQQCEAVIKELHDSKFREMGFNPDRIVLMGDSAGGNLTAVTCQRLKRQGNGDYIKSQILVYPVIHMLDFMAPSYQLYYYRYKGTALLNPVSLARWYLMYVGIEPTWKNVKLMLKNQHLHRDILESQDFAHLVSHDHLPLGLHSKPHYQKPLPAKPDPVLSEKFAAVLKNPDICPIVAKDMDGLPPALILTAGIDILRDEGVHYARKLKAHGVWTRWNHYESAFHGVMNMPKSKQRQQMLDDIHSHLVELRLL